MFSERPGKEILLFSMLGIQKKGQTNFSAKVVFRLNSWIEIPQTDSALILNSFLTKEKNPILVSRVVAREPRPTHTQL